MKALTNRISWGLLLIAGGVLLLLQNLEVLPQSASLWTIIFGLFGLYFLLIFLSNAEHWWTAFPAFTLLGLAGTIYVTETPGIKDEWGGAVFLGSVALGFFAIYLRRRQHWWPLIPGGALASLTGIVAATAMNPNPPASLITSILFGGLALTSLVLYIAPSEAGRARWAIWPAIVLVVMTFITGTVSLELGGYVLPVILIVLGGAILIRNLQGK